MLASNADPFSTVAVFVFGLLSCALIPRGFGGRVRRADRAESKHLYHALEAWIDTHPTGYHSPDNGWTIYSPRRRWVAPWVLRMSRDEVDLPTVDTDAGVVLYKVFTLADLPKVICQVDGRRLTFDDEDQMKHLPTEKDRRWQPSKNARKIIATDRAGHNQASLDELRVSLADLERSVPITTPAS